MTIQFAKSQFRTHTHTYTYTRRTAFNRVQRATTSIQTSATQPASRIQCNRYLTYNENALSTKRHKYLDSSLGKVRWRGAGDTRQRTLETAFFFSFGAAPST